LQFDDEHRTRASAGLGFDVGGAEAAAKFVDDGLRNCQSQPEPLARLLRRIKRFEQSGQRFGRDAGPAVAETHLHGAGRHRGFDDDFLSIFAHGARVDCIGEQVDEHLLRANRASQCDGFVGNGRHADRHVVCFAVRLHERERLLDRLADRYRFALHRIVASECLDVRHDFSHPRGQIVDELEIARQLANTLKLDETDRVVRERHQGRQRLVQFMRDARRHLPQCGELAGLDRRIARIAQYPPRVIERFHLAGEIAVGLRQLGRTLRDARFEIAMCRL
jgi:hypothetical protein